MVKTQGRFPGFGGNGTGRDLWGFGRFDLGSVPTTKGVGERKNTIKRKMEQEEEEEEEDKEGRKEKI